MRIGFESGKWLLSCLIENDDLEATHKESTIDQFCWIVGIAVVEDSIILVRFVSQKSGKFSRESVYHGEIKRTEVFVEREVGQVIIHVEEECVFVILWWLRIWDPV